MSTRKQLLNKSNSISAIRQVSQAMEIVSIVKYERLKTEISSERAIKEKIENIAAAAVLGSKKNNIFIQEKIVENTGPVGILIIGSDRGLAGGYNISIMNRTLELTKEFKNRKIVVYPIGRKLNAFVKKIPNAEVIQNDFIINEKIIKPTVDHMVKSLITDYLDKKITELHIVHTEAPNIMVTQTATTKVLPIIKEEVKALRTENVDYVLEPNADDVLIAAIPYYIASTLEAIIVESLFSEHLSRRLTMENAVKNADEMLGKIKLQMNRARQATITQEVSEIASNVTLKKNKE